MKAVCLHAGPKQHVKGITAPPRMMRLWPVDTARSTVRCHRICAVCSQTCPQLHSVTKRAHLCWRTDALPMNLASELERRTGVRHQRYPEAPRQPEKAVTCGENQAARNQTVDAPSVHQQNARKKTPVHAHDASNHTMDTTGACHPLKLRWHALTWKPTANGEHPTKQRDASQFLRCRTKDTHTTTDLVNFLPLGKHNFVTIERRTLTKTQRTRNIRHMRQTKKTAATLRR